MNILLSGVVGSTAYGLAGPDSDVDRLGVYAAPTVQFHGLHPPVGKAASIVRNAPDVTYHEAGKLASLCAAGPPYWRLRDSRATLLRAKGCTGCPIA